MEIKKDFQINEPCFCCKNLVKEEQIKSKPSGRKENNKIKSRAQQKLKTEKEKNQIISRFYEKISKISKPLPRLIRKKKDTNYQHQE